MPTIVALSAINPNTQRFLAERMGARIRSEKVDHTPMVTEPGPVIDLLFEAASLAAKKGRG